MVVFNNQSYIDKPVERTKRYRLFVAHHSTFDLCHQDSSFHVTNIDTCRVNRATVNRHCDYSRMEPLLIRTQPWRCRRVKTGDKPSPLLWSQRHVSIESRVTAVPLVKCWKVILSMHLRCSMVMFFRWHSRKSIDVAMLIE